MVGSVVLLAALAQYVSDRVYARAQSKMAHVCCTCSKQASLAYPVNMCHVPCSQWLHCSLYVRTPVLYLAQFSTADVVVAPATSQINRVGCFNALVPHCDPNDHDNSCIDITVGPDSFANMSLIDPSVVDLSWESIDLPPISVSGVDGLSSNLP